MIAKISHSNSSKPSLLKDTRGLSTVEYIILLVLLAVGCIRVWSTFGETVRTKITTSTTEIEGMQ